MKQLVGAGGAIVYAVCQWNVFALQIPITLHKEPELDPEGREVLKCGFKIGGGIDQDYRKSPQGYTDNVCLLYWHLWPVHVLYLYTSHNINIVSYKAGRNHSTVLSLLAGIEGERFPLCMYVNGFRSVKNKYFLGLITYIGRCSALFCLFPTHFINCNQ